MVFVADRIPAELRRIVEFLNEQMRPAEVLAIELEQFANSNGVRTIVPRILGNTQRAQAAKSIGGFAEALSEEAWLNDFEKRWGPAAGKMGKQAVAWFREIGFQSGITDSQDSIYLATSKANGKPGYPFFIRRSTGKLETSLQNMQSYAPYASDSERQTLLERIKALPGVTVTTTKHTGWPGILLSEVEHPDVWKGFQDIARDVQTRLMTGT